MKYIVSIVYGTDESVEGRFVTKSKAYRFLKTNETDDSAVELQVIDNQSFLFNRYLNEEAYEYFAQDAPSTRGLLHG